MPGIGSLARAYDAGRERIRSINREAQMAFWVPKVEWRPVLVDTRIAMSQLGFTAETIHEMREAGELRWVWDVSVKAAEIQSARYWVGELIRLKTGDTSARQMVAADVIARVVGHETQLRLRSLTVCHLLLITHPTLQFLHREGELRGEVERGVRWTDRQSLIEFLTRRLIS